MEIQDLVQRLADLAHRVREADAMLLAQAIIEIRRFRPDLWIVNPEKADQSPDMAFVATHVSQAFGVPADLFFTSDRRLHIAAARAMLMYLLKELSGNGWSQIGRYLKKDHSTIMAGHRRIAARMKRDRAYSALVHRIARTILTQRENKAA